MSWFVASAERKALFRQNVCELGDSTVEKLSALLGCDRHVPLYMPSISFYYLLNTARASSDPTTTVTIHLATFGQFAYFHIKNSPTGKTNISNAITPIFNHRLGLRASEASRPRGSGERLSSDFTGTPLGSTASATRSSSRPPASRSSAFHPSLNRYALLPRGSRDGSSIPIAFNIATVPTHSLRPG